MLLITEDEVRQHLRMRECVRLMRETFAALRNGTAINQPRRRMTLPTGSVLHSMAGAIGKYFGTKFYSANPKSGAHFFFFLFDAETAKPLAQFEANHLGQIRTGAASGYATDLMADPGASSLAIIGTGFQAQTQLAAMRTARNFSDIRVWSRSEEKRNRFAAENGARATATAEEAVRGADVVVTATWAKDPVLEAEWISPGAHINAMGSNQAQRRELPSALIARADLIACDSIEVAKIESGDLLLAPVDWDKEVDAGRIVDLSQVERRPPGTPITIFKSNGLGVEDVAAAAYIYEKLI